MSKKPDKTEIRLDWLTLTQVGEYADSPTRARFVLEKTLSELGISDEYQWTNAQRHYPFVANVGDGCQIAISDKPSQGIRVSLSGNWFSTHDQRSAAENAIGLTKSAWRVTRTDIALDVYGLDYVPKDIDAEREEKYTGRPRRRQIWDEKGGFTLYIGSRESEKMVRIYDKGAERGIDAAITRFEAEYKAGAALPALMAFVGRNWGGFVADLKAFIGVPEGLTKPIFEAFNPGDGIKPIAKETSFVEWFRKSVIPAMNKARNSKSQEYRDVIGLLVDSGHIEQK